MQSHYGDESLLILAPIERTKKIHVHGNINKKEEAINVHNLLRMTIELRNTKSLKTLKMKIGFVTNCKN